MSYPKPSFVIQKEDIPNLKFSQKEALQSKKKQNLRSYYLHRATRLGNLLKNKVHIYFKDQSDKLIRVHTTIWAVTTDFVVLKQGITIPKRSILYVD